MSPSVYRRAGDGRIDGTDVAQMVAHLEHTHNCAVWFMVDTGPEHYPGHLQLSAHARHNMGHLDGKQMVKGEMYHFPRSDGISMEALMYRMLLLLDVRLGETKWSQDRLWPLTDG